VIARSREPAPRIATALGLLALILTVAEVQTVGAAIVPGCFGNRGLSCRGTKSSNPSPSSGESTANLGSTAQASLGPVAIIVTISFPSTSNEGVLGDNRGPLTVS
jgi:hypothetical protein